MNNILFFLGGVITTILVTAFLLWLSVPVGMNGLTMLPEKGECITRSALKVFQVIEPTVALTTERGSQSSAVYMVMNDDEKLYFDEQIINIPQKQCARQIGTYKYQTKNENWKTVPVVVIE